MVNDHLTFHFYKGYQVVRDLSIDYPVNNNPLEMRIAPLLYEQQLFLWNALFILQQGLPDRKQFRYVVSVMYRSNEAFDPIYRAWIRASRWMESAQPEVLQTKKELSNILRHHLICAVPYIQQIYGKYDAKFIIPPLYRYEIEIMK